jgi:hypothetical protein
MWILPVQTKTNTGISPLRRQKNAAFGRDDVHLWWRIEKGWFE